MCYQLTFFGNYQKPLAPSSFRLATSEELAASKEHRSITLGTAKAWSCNYCQDFFMKETAETACAIRAHLKERRVIVFINDDLCAPDLGPIGTGWWLPGYTKTMSFILVVGRASKILVRSL
jgi:hypothetical protein